MKDGRVGKTEELLVERRLVAYNDKLQKRDLESIDTIVIHCTELPDVSMCREFAERVHYKSGTGNCGHFYIYRDGSCVQFAELNRVAHHVVGHNEKSVGVELMNRGRYPHWWRRDHQEMTQDYTEEQYKTLAGLLGFLKNELPGLKHLYGHSELDERLVAAEDDPAKRVRRKLDPGPLFDWDRVCRVWGETKKREKNC